MATDTENIPAIEFRHVSLSYDDKLVLDDVSFRLERGEMIFITGLAGSGKSVLLKLAIALEHSDCGQILIEGRDVALLDETDLLDLRGNRLGIVFQEDSLFTGLTVYDNVAYRLVEHNVPDDETDTAVMEVLRFVGLDRDAEKLPSELSGGMRRRLELARALVGWRSIMLFDEPASGLDPLTAVQILDLIVRARDVQGMSSIYVTKKLDEIPYIANHRARQIGERIVIEEVTSAPNLPTCRVMVLDEGRIVFTGAVAEFEASSLPAVTRLTRAETGRVISDYPVADPWDKRRRPREPVL
jgi:phospholipid/cholesterol/gamma-HCH transport system ATP-binding protein